MEPEDTGTIDIIAELKRISERMSPPSEYVGDRITWKGVELYWADGLSCYVSIPD